MTEGRNYDLDQDRDFPAFESRSRDRGRDRVLAFDDGSRDTGILPHGVCRYWYDGRGCRNMPQHGGDCRSAHPDNMTSRNVCHKDDRGDRSGLNCSRLHMRQGRAVPGSILYQSRRAEEASHAMKLQRAERAGSVERSPLRGEPSHSWSGAAPGQPVLSPTLMSAKIDFKPAARVDSDLAASMSDPWGLNRSTNLLDLQPDTQDIRAPLQPQHIQFLFERIKEHRLANGPARTYADLELHKNMFGTSLDIWAKEIMDGGAELEIKGIEAKTHLLQDLFISIDDLSGVRNFVTWIASLHKQMNLRTDGTPRAKPSFLPSKSPPSVRAFDPSNLPAPAPTATPATPPDTIQEKARPPPPLPVAPATNPKFKQPPPSALLAKGPPPKRSHISEGRQLVANIMESAWPQSRQLMTLLNSGTDSALNIVLRDPSVQIQHPPEYQIPPRLRMDTTVPILHALGTAQSLDLERRALGLTSTAVNAMQYDLDTAPNDATRKQLVDTWWDVYETTPLLSGATAVQHSFIMRALELWHAMYNENP